LHSVFKQSCNLINEQQNLMALTLPSVPLGPFAVQLDLPAFTRFSDLIQPGQPVHIEGMCLSSGALTVDAGLLHATWHPQPAWHKLLAQTAPPYHTLLPLLHTAPADSLASLLSDSSSHAPYRPGVAQMGLGLRQKSAGICRAAASQLAGLGLGLTPAGDDFLLGVIFALWGRMPALNAKPLVEAIAATAIPRTNQISATWLKAGQEGYAGMPWHRLINALISADLAAIQQAGQRILQTGHTSGADALTGFLFALQHL